METWIDHHLLCRYLRAGGNICFVKAIATAANGEVWAAIEQSGPVLQLKHFEHGSWTTRTFSGITVSSADVTQLFVDRDNALWVGTAHHGLFRVGGMMPIILGARTDCPAMHRTFLPG